MIRASRTNPTIAVAVAAMLAVAATAAKIGGICPSVCPSDWDKRKTPFVSPYAKGTYEGRLQSRAERTGFEPADQFPGHRFSKPALSTTQPPLQSIILQSFTSFLVRSFNPLLLPFVLLSAVSVEESPSADCYRQWLHHLRAC